MNDAATPTPTPTLSATLQPVKNRGRPPQAFILELVTTLRGLPDEVFAPNPRLDIYSAVEPVLGPYPMVPDTNDSTKMVPDISYRRAVMAEVLRVLAGFESSWNWNEGVDTNNPSSNTPETMEAGAWQVSANSRAFGPDLRALAPGDGVAFQRLMKQNHPVAIEYIARLLRWTINHNGPTKRHEIDAWLKKDAVAEFQALMADPSADPALDPAPVA